jgi:hypothetical protein
VVLIRTFAFWPSVTYGSVLPCVAAWISAGLAGEVLTASHCKTTRADRCLTAVRRRRRTRPSVGLAFGSSPESADFRRTRSEHNRSIAPDTFPTTSRDVDCGGLSARVHARSPDHGAAHTPPVAVTFTVAFALCGRQNGPDSPARRRFVPLTLDVAGRARVDELQPSARP